VTSPGQRRAAALVSLAGGATTVAFAFAVTVRGFPRGLSVLACLLIALFAAFEGILRHRGVIQLLAIAVTVAASAAALALVLLEGRLFEDLLIVVGTAVTVGAARVAFAVRVHLPKAAAPRHPVLFYNPRSGGGKAERFHLAEEARARGIEAVELRAGDDLRALVLAAVERGADGLAMAGGDGSQAVVAEIAAEHDLPYACVPAGTRNHFALDLGVDRDDVVGGLDAFVEGGERRVDLAEVNGRVFVNNVSLGIYADAVQQAGYRDAKLRTLLQMAPERLGPDAERSDLRWDGYGGHEDSTAVALLVSNNRYRVGKVLASGTRPQMDAGALGVTILMAAERPKALSWLGPHWRQWSCRRFRVEAGSPVAAGIDGEAVTLAPPLRFRTRHRALRARIAHGHPGASPSAGSPNGVFDAIGSLTLIALDKPQKERVDGHIRG
jgi:diacylglycerol kinase family enzyme